MDYLVAVVSDRIKAEEAYTALEKGGIPTSQMSILGKDLHAILRYKNANFFCQKPQLDLVRKHFPI